MKRKNDNNFNPLSKIWEIFSIISGLISVVSLTDNFIAWKGFLPEIITSYKNIVYYPFKFLEINWNEHIIDYLFIGVLCGIAFIKAIEFGEKNSLLNNRGNPKLVRVVYFLIYLLLWPVGIIITFKQVFFNFEDESEKQIKTTFLRWLAAIIFSFIIIVILNKLF